MGTRFLLDTNSVIYYINEDLPASALSFLDNILEEDANLSVISKIELLSWQPAAGLSLAPYEMLVASASILPLTDTIVQKTIRVKRSKKIKLPDAIIAATALVHGFTIISRNKSDFSGIPGLICLDPFTDL